MRWVLVLALLSTTSAAAPSLSSGRATEATRPEGKALPGVETTDPGPEPAPSSTLLAGLLGAALTAADEARYCDALFLFEALQLRQPSPRAIYNAAEVAYAAGDRVKALDLYRTTQILYPHFEKRDLIQKRADAVFAAMVKAGPGTACALRDDLCGDWLLRPNDGEQCDDGNRQDGDGCDGNCTLTACGNGAITAGEQCDDQNRIDGDGCDSNCTHTSCGNGVRTERESCDDGNGVDGDGCDHSCVPTSCGNGVVTQGEECDDGNDSDGDGCDRGCQVSRCGNAVTTGLEQCDDGNDVDGDGCEHDCSRTRLKRPWPGVILSVVSGVGVLSGGGLTWLGSTPLGGIAAAEARFADAPAASLDDAEQARADFSSWGLPALLGGGSLVVAGSVGVGVGIWMALTDTEIQGAQ